MLFNIILYLMSFTIFTTNMPSANITVHLSSQVPDPARLPCKLHHTSTSLEQACNTHGVEALVDIIMQEYFMESYSQNPHELIDKPRIFTYLNQHLHKTQSFVQQTKRSSEVIDKSFFKCIERCLKNELNLVNSECT